MNSWVLFLENLLSDRAFPAKYGTSQSKISPSAPTTHTHNMVTLHASGLCT